MIQKEQHSDEEHRARRLLTRSKVHLLVSTCYTYTSSKRVFPSADMMPLRAELEGPLGLHVNV